MNPSNNPIEHQPTVQSSPEQMAKTPPAAEALRPTSQPAEAVQQPIAPPAPQAPVAPPATETPAQASEQASSDLTAADVDVIEKPWVDKAEAIIEQNKDNPFEEEKAEDKLSAQYQKQRFDIDVGDNNS